MPPVQALLDLLAEKDWLIREKDELVESKNKMWREYYDLLQEKDVEIHKLRQEVIDVKGRSKQLEVALRDLLDEQEDSEEEVADEEGSGSEEVQAQAHAEERDSDKTTVNKVDIDTDNRHNDDVGIHRRFSDTRPRATKQPDTKSPVNINEIDHDAFGYAPLIRVTDGGQDEFGQIDGVAVPVIQSIQSTMTALRNGQHGGPMESTCCAWRYLEGHRSLAPWSLELPRRYACRACFNAKRACLLWIGAMQWIVLPVPPQVRSKHVTWRDDAYYIYQGWEDAADYPGVWRESTRSKKRKVAEVAD